MAVSYKNKIIIFLTMMTSYFALTGIQTSSVYAQGTIMIDTATVGGSNFAFGEVIAPSEQNPIEFGFNSDESLTYTCKIIKIDETLFNELVAASETVANAINLVGTEIRTDDCETGTEGSIQYAQSFANGFYAFQVIGTTGTGTGTKAVWIFEVQGGQAGTGGPEAAGKVAVDVKQFWTKCDDLTSPTTINLGKIEYTIQGRANIDDLNFDSNTLKLIIKTNDLNKAISAKLSSASSKDFRIKNVDTECIYDLPEKAGQPLVPGPTKAFNSKTLDAWNPPVPQCVATGQYVREITYPFKVTSNLAELKDADSNNVEIEFIVDAAPKNDIKIQGQLLLGDDKKNIDVEIAHEPEVECSGKTLIG